MTQTEVAFFQDSDGKVPLLQWLRGLDSKVRGKCLAKLDLLEQLGHDLRRPHADALRDGIRELRVAHQRVHYRMLFFSEGKNFVVVSHGIQKEDSVPPGEIEKAIERRNLYRKNPSKHTFPKKKHEKEKGVSVQGSSTRL